MDIKLLQWPLFVRIYPVSYWSERFEIAAG